MWSRARRVFSVMRIQDVRPRALETGWRARVSRAGGGCRPPQGKALPVRHTETDPDSPRLTRCTWSCYSGPKMTLPQEAAVMIRWHLSRSAQTSVWPAQAV